MSNFATAADYTPQQLGLVMKVKRCQNFYQMLNVAYDANEVIIKKAYKRLALQLHPDKNHAPGACDAFQLISKAVSVLGNNRKREAYDYANMQNLNDNWVGIFNDNDNTNDTQCFQSTCMTIRYKPATLVIISAVVLITILWWISGTLNKILITA